MCMLATQKPAAGLLLLIGLLTLVIIHPVQGTEEEAKGHTAGGEPVDCDAGSEGGYYNFLEHALGIFLVLVVSAAGAVLPVVGARYPWLRIPPVLLEVGKHFGTGVVLATGFMHLLPDSLFFLNDPCLPEPVRAYPELAGAIVCVAALMFHMIEFLTTAHAMKGHGSGGGDGGAEARSMVARPTGSFSLDGAEKSHGTGLDGLAERIHDGHHDSDDSGQATQKAVSGWSAHETSSVAAPAPAHIHHHSHHDHGHSHGLAFLEPGGIDPARRISTYMLEFGIALHSIFVGLSLGTAEGSDFVTLLIAISFHQFFEGIALGSRIAELPYKSVWMPVLNAVLVASTTPLGAVIGMGIRSVYRARSANTLVIQGILNAISSGMLIYTALVNLISQEFNRPEFMTLPTKLKMMYFVALYLGTAAMGLVGIWA